MAKVVLIRHGRSTANADGVLAGRTPGIGLDERGREQAAALRAALGGSRFAAAYTSPVQRCVETAALAGFPGAEVVDGLSECDYGVWTGAKLSDLVTEAMWREIQAKPSDVTFPGGEGMLEMSRRAVAAMAAIVGRHPGETVAVFSHGDPIKAILADALAIGFDEFQRLHVNPAGISVIDYSGAKPLVLCLNAVAGDVPSLLGDTGPTLGGGDSPEPGGI